MQINEISIRGLHGALNFDIRLQPGINLLVGINGSGKTSVLNLIDWLLRPNWLALATTRFDFVRMSGTTDQGEAFAVKATQSERLMDVFYESGSISPQPVNVKLHSRVDGSESVNKIEDLMERYSRLGPEPHEMATWNALIAIPKPIVISLDRRITVEESSGSIYLDIEQQPRGLRKKLPGNTLDWVLDTSRTAYAQYKTRLLELNDQLKNEVMLSSFEGGIDAPAQSAKLPTIKDVEQVEGRLLGQVLTWSKDPVAREQISRYFARLKKIVVQLGRSDSSTQQFVSELYRGEVHRVDTLSNAFRKFETSSEIAHEPIRRYLSALNRFLNDSGKSVAFEDKNNSLGPVLNFVFEA